MREFFESIMPNVIPKLPALWNATLETLAMTGLSALYILVIGMALGILLTVTKKGGLMQNTAVYRILDIIINMLDFPAHRGNSAVLLPPGGGGSRRSKSRSYRSRSVYGLLKARNHFQSVP